MPLPVNWAPCLGSGISHGYKQHAEASQVTELIAVPTPSWIRFIRPITANALSLLMPPSPSRPITEPSPSRAPSLSWRESTSLRERESCRELRELRREGHHLRYYKHHWWSWLRAEVRYRPGLRPQLSAPAPRVQSKGSIVKREAVGAKKGIR
jgi:hypothetical protein